MLIYRRWTRLHTKIKPWINKRFAMSYFPFQMLIFRVSIRVSLIARKCCLNRKGDLRMDFMRKIKSNSKILTLLIILRNCILILMIKKSNSKIKLICLNFNNRILRKKNLKMPKNKIQSWLMKIWIQTQLWTNQSFLTFKKKT